MNRRKNVRYLVDIAYQAAGNSAAQVVAIAGIPVLTRLYSPEAFAAQSIFVQIVIFFSAFIMFRFEYFVPLLKSSSETTALYKWGFITGCFTTISLTFFIFLADLFKVGSSVGVNDVWYLYFAPATAFIATIATFHQFEIQRAEKFKVSALAEFFSKLVYVFSGFLLSFFTVVVGLLLTTFFSALAKGALLKIYEGRNKSEKPLSKRECKEIIISFKKRSIGMVFSNCLVSLASLIPLFFIGSKYGAASLGQFSLVMATIFLPSALIGSAIGSVFYQRAAKLWHERSFKELQNLWFYTVKNLFFVSVPIYFVCYLFSEWAYPFIFGGQWVQAGTFAKVLTGAAFFSFLAGPLDRVSIIAGVGIYLPIIHGLRLLMLVALCFIAEYFIWSVEVYLISFSCVMVVLYALDILFGRLFLCTK